MIWDETQDGATMEKQFYSDQEIEKFQHKLLLKSLGFRVVKTTTILKERLDNAN